MNYKFLLILFLLSNGVFSQSSYVKVDSVITHVDDIKLFNGKIVSQLRNCIDNKAVKIYYKSVGYDSISVDVKGVRVLDTLINNRASDYYKRIYTLKENINKKNNGFSFYFHDFNKYIDVVIQSNIKIRSIVVIPHIDEKLIVESEILKDKVKNSYELYTDYVDVHYLTFDYLEYLKKKYDRKIND